MKYKILGALIIAIVLLILVNPIENTAYDSEVSTTQIVCDKNPDAEYFNNLDDKDKEVYNKILKDLLEFNSTTEVESYSVDNFKTLYKCVLADHPEIFYMKHGEVAVYNIEDSTNLIAYWEYYVTKEYADAVRDNIADSVEIFKNSILDCKNDYDKLYKGCEYIMNLAEYDESAFNSQNIDSVFVWHKTVCGGYASAFKYLMNNIGIDCKFVVGYVDDTYHAWNKVYIDSKEFCIDVTWCDARNDFEYFLVPIEEFNKTHIEDENYILIEDAMAEYNMHLK